MALHEYDLNGLRYQFEDDDAPAGAKRVDGKKADAPAADKSRTPKNKAAKPAAKKPDAKKPDPKVEAASDPGASE